MDLKSINTEGEYKQVLERLEVIFDAKKGSKEGEELEILSNLVEQYENKNFPIEKHLVSK